jgi:serine-type D-Ala-D-Ala carboxypeptidase (penicillin-binding protein 5/6)
MRLLFRALVACALVLGGAGVASANPAPQASVPSAPAVGMAAGILVDAATGKVIWSQNADAERAPASLTKVLTALVVLDQANLDDNVTVTPEARAVGGSRIYVESGWVMPARDLLWGLLLQSGNDAAVALAQKVSPDGTIAGFSKLMDERARQLGATHSRFVNPHGLDDPGHMTTARDLAIITSAALRNPTFAEMVATQRHDIPWGDGTSHTLLNHNKLLGRFAGTVGVKTGYTLGAGQSLISAVRRGDHTLIAVVLGSPSQGHYNESIALYDWGFANLPALLAQPQSVLPPPPAAPPARVGAPVPAEAGASSRVAGLDVEQLGDSAAAINTRRYPVTTAVGLAAAALVGLVLVRRRPRTTFRAAGPEGPVDRPPLRLGPELRRSRHF